MVNVDWVGYKLGLVVWKGDWALGFVLLGWVKFIVF